MINLLVILFILKLFAQKNIFNYVKEKYGKEIRAEVRDFERQRMKLAKIELDIGFLS